jgi:hypothetical protein
MMVRYTARINVTVRLLTQLFLAIWQTGYPWAVPFDVKVSMAGCPIILIKE